MNEPIEIESKALVVREKPGAMAQALTVEELHERLEFVRRVMRQEMREGQDFGKIPGVDKPSLLQPGAQKLLMTFNLREQVKKETLREYPNYHREYEFTVTVFPSGQDPANGWDGVGTCSTLESKYRYRKLERRCPKCGKHTIIAGKEEFGGGWLCWKKKGGCGEKFAFNAPDIASQQTGRVDNPDIPDSYNTVRKMAFKRALVAAAINATNTSELWTQDVEDNPDIGADAPEPPSAPTQPPKDPEKPVSAPKPRPVATTQSREKMIAQLKAGPGEPNRELVTEYFVKVGQILETEDIEDLPLCYCPATVSQMRMLASRLAEFGNGGMAAPAFPPNEEAEKPPVKAEPEKNPKTKIPDQPSDEWREYEMPFGKHEGTPLCELDKRYLYGLWSNFTVETEWKGKPRDPEKIEQDTEFRAMLDLAGEHYAFTKND